MIHGIYFYIFIINMFFTNSKIIKIDKNFSFFLSPTKQFDRATPKSLNKPSYTLYGH